MVIPNEVRGVGFLARALSEAILDNNYAGAFNDVLTGLGLLGLHVNIQQALTQYEKTEELKSNQ